MLWMFSDQVPYQAAEPASLYPARKVQTDAERQHDCAKHSMSPEFDLKSGHDMTFVVFYCHAWEVTRTIRTT